LIQWDPEYGSHISSTVKQGAEQAYIHAIRDPGYFQNLYFSNSWGNWESNNLEIYLQYGNNRTTAESFLFQDKDIYAARIARGYIILGDETKAREYLQTTFICQGLLSNFAKGRRKNHETTLHSISKR
jgi:hypothetical protein